MAEEKEAANPLFAFGKPEKQGTKRLSLTPTMERRAAVRQAIARPRPNVQRRFHPLSPVRNLWVADSFERGEGSIFAIG